MTSSLGTKITALKSANQQGYAKNHPNGSLHNGKCRQRLTTPLTCDTCTRTCYTCIDIMATQSHCVHENLPMVPQCRLQLADAVEGDEIFMGCEYTDRERLLLQHVRCNGQYGVFKSVPSQYRRILSGHISRDI
jgi:hypothetical protein